MKKMMKISKFLALTFALSLFLFSCQHKENNSSSPSPSFSPMSFSLSYAGWGKLDMEKSLNDGFAVYGCSSVRLKDVKVASVNYDGEPDLEFFGAVGGMGEIDIEGDSYISGDLVYPPGGTFSVSSETEVKGFKYAWGVSECPWWSYESANDWNLASTYPSVLTVSSKVTLEAGGYRFRLLDIEGGGELYGRDVSIVAERVVVNGGKLVIGRGLLISENFEVNSGEVSGIIFTDIFSGRDVVLKGKISAESVLIDKGQVFYNGDIICRENICQIPYSLEVSGGVVRKGFLKITTNYFSTFTRVKLSYFKDPKTRWPWWENFEKNRYLPVGTIDKKDGLSYLLQLALVMKKLGYCLRWIRLSWSCCGYPEWTPSVSNRKPGLFYLTRLLREVGRKGEKEGKLLPFVVAGMGDASYVDLTRVFQWNEYQSYLTTEIPLYRGLSEDGYVIDFSKVFRGTEYQNYLNYITEVSGIDNPDALPAEWKSYAEWVSSSCRSSEFVPRSVTDSIGKSGMYEIANNICWKGWACCGDDKPLPVSEVTPVLIGHFLTDNKTYADDLKVQLSSILTENGFINEDYCPYYPSSGEDCEIVKSGWLTGEKSPIFLHFYSISNSWHYLDRDFLQDIQNVKKVFEDISRYIKETGPAEVTGSVTVEHGVQVGECCEDCIRLDYQKSTIP